MSRVTTALRELFIKNLEQHLPRRTKRLLFLASLSARVKEEPEFDNETLHKLNRLMELSNSDSALKLPIHLSRVIWQGKTIQEICGEEIVKGQLTPDRIQLAAQRVQSLMPSWLRYGRPEDITKDLKQLLTHRQILATA